MSEELKETQPQSVPPADSDAQSRVVEIDEAHGSGKNSGRVALIVALITLLFLMALAAALLFFLTGGLGGGGRTVAGVTWIRSIYGTGPEQHQQHSPGDAHPAPSGSRMFVTDQFGMRIIEYDHNGMYHGSFGGPDTLPYPSNLAIAADGTKYIAMQTHDRIVIYDSNNNQIGAIELPESPFSVAVNQDMLLVGMRGAFGAFELDGTEIGYVGSFGNGEFQFDNISGVALDNNNNAYIVDTFNNRISKYDPAGERIWIHRTGVPRNAGMNIALEEDLEVSRELFPSNMQMPMGATIDAANRLVIVDMMDFSIAAFDMETGEFIDKWGTFGEADGALHYPNQIEYHRGEDVFYIVETALGRVQIVSLPGSGGGLLTQLNRNLAGPLGACLLPVLLIIVIATAYYVARKIMRKRAEEAEIKAQEAPEDTEMGTKTGE
ncbi:MAG: NHL repeat-containing protein [Coriobacteriia bacterium]|nr:NHL repeat-containing protein [Coriobacteriia bacterium]